MNLRNAAVLIVDDEPDLREIFSMVMSIAGCPDVYTAKDGVGAIAILMEHSVDCLITDIRMPGMDGITLVRRLAEMKKMPPCVVFVSGFSDVDQREMYGLGVESFLSKPLMPQDLLVAVEKALLSRDSLWRTPMAATPRQSIVMELERGKTADFQLGRGGFSARYCEPLALGKVTFSCHFSGEQEDLSGEGYVRWRSLSECKVGIEFFYVAEPGRGWAVKELAFMDTSSFIPYNQRRP